MQVTKYINFITVSKGVPSLKTNTKSKGSSPLILQTIIINKLLLTPKKPATTLTPSNSRIYLLIMQNGSKD